MTKNRLKKYNINVNKTIQVPCKPMKSILNEAKIEKIDFFSLDVEGAELIVLDTMDWSIPVSIFLIETNSHKKEIREKMLNNGFRLANFSIRSFCRRGRDCGENDVFVNEKFQIS